MLTSNTLYYFSDELVKLSGIPVQRQLSIQGRLARNAVRMGTQVNPVYQSYLMGQINRSAAGNSASRLLGQAKRTEDIGQLQNLTQSAERYKNTGRMAAFKADGVAPPVNPLPNFPVM